MARRFPANSIHLMKNSARKKGSECNLAKELQDHRWCPCFRILAGQQLSPASPSIVA